MVTTSTNTMSSFNEYLEFNRDYFIERQHPYKMDAQEIDSELMLNSIKGELRTESQVESCLSVFQSLEVLANMCDPDDDDQIIK